MDEMTRIYVREIARHGKFNVTLASGETIVRSSRQPMLDAARALLRRGISGKIEMWGGYPPMLRMSADIEKAAGLTIEERDKGGLRLGKYVPLRHGAFKDGDSEEG